MANLKLQNNLLNSVLYSYTSVWSVNFQTEPQPRDQRVISNRSHVSHLCKKGWIGLVVRVNDMLRILIGTNRTALLD